MNHCPSFPAGGARGLEAVTAKPTPKAKSMAGAEVLWKTTIKQRICCCCCCHRRRRRSRRRRVKPKN